ncbi:hypothetical protein MKW98_011436, partial [Papaver atlanticum]
MWFSSSKDFHGFVLSRHGVLSIAFFSRLYCHKENKYQRISTQMRLVQPCFLKIQYMRYLQQACALLQKNLDNAKANIEVLIADLQLLRDQVTITR